MASKKKLKEKLKAERHVADELFIQVGMLAGQLHVVDQILASAELPGPTIEAWAQQVRDLLSSLVKERGIVSGGIAEAFTLQRVAVPSGARTDGSDDGEYTFLRDGDLKPFTQETRDIIEGRMPASTSVPAGTDRFA